MSAVPPPLATTRAHNRPEAGARTVPMRVGLLTGADDLSYALGLTESLVARGVEVDFIGSDTVDAPALHTLPGVRFLNLRGDQAQNAPALRKVGRVLRYYARLIAYAVRSQAPVFHVLWNNKFQHLDRTLLMLWYRLCGRTVVLTAHNVNAARRDGRDTALNRLTLRIQYQLSAQVFVHTRRMADELQHEFAVPAERISVIPFGLNTAFTTTDLTAAEARQRLGLAPQHRVMLFFGQIAPYKGLEYLVRALPALVRDDPALRLVIAGKVKQGAESYWATQSALLDAPQLAPHVIRHVRFIANDDVEMYFKAADVLVLPYVTIYQSGVPFLGYGHGLPVIASDVGSLRDDIEEGFSGHVCRPCDPEDLAAAVRRYFVGDTYRQLPERRAQIRAWASERHSWATVAEVTAAVYTRERSIR